MTLGPWWRCEILAGARAAWSYLSQRGSYYVIASTFGYPPFRKYCGARPRGARGGWRAGGLTPKGSLCVGRERRPLREWPSASTYSRVDMGEDVRYVSREVQHEEIIAPAHRPRSSAPGYASRSRAVRMRQLAGEPHRRAGPGWFGGSGFGFGAQPPAGTARQPVVELRASVASASRCVLCGRQCRPLRRKSRRESGLSSASRLALRSPLCSPRPIFPYPPPV